MPIMTPGQPGYFREPRKKTTKSSGQHEGQKTKKREHGYKPQQLIVNGLCKIGRQYLGGNPVPNTIQEARGQLQLHLMHGGNGMTRPFNPCPNCSIPNMVPLNHPSRNLQKVLKKKLGEDLNNPIIEKHKVRRAGSFDERMYNAYISAAHLWNNRGNKKQELIALEKAKEMLEKMNGDAKTLKIIETDEINQETSIFSSNG